MPLFRFCFCLGLTLGFWGEVFAQQQGLVLSESRQRERTDRSHALLRMDSTGFEVLRFDRDNRYAEIEVYDAQQRYVETRPCTDRQRRYIGLVDFAPNKRYLLFFNYRRNSQTQRFEQVALYAKAMNPQTFALEGDSLVLIAPFAMESPYYKGNFAISPDKTKLLVYDYEEDGDIEGVEGLTNKINLRVYNRDFELIWERKLNLSPSAKRMVAIKRLRLSNAGEVAILSDVFKDEQQRSYTMRYPTTIPTLFFVGERPEHFLQFSPDLEGQRFYGESDFNYDLEGNLFWFGFYSEQRYYQQKGYFFIKINAERSRILVKNQVPFSDSLISLMRERKRIKAGLEALHFKLCQWRILEDGAMVFSAERQPPGQNFKTHNLILIRLDAKGELVQSHHLDKYADHSPSLKPFMSHYFWLKGQDVYLVYNTGLHNGARAVLLRFDALGQVKRRKLLDYSAQLDLLCPNLTEPLAGGRAFLILQSRYFRQYSFGILDPDVWLGGN